MFNVVKEIIGNLEPAIKNNLLSALKPFIKELESMYNEQKNKDSNKARILKMIIKTANELYLLLIQ